MKSKLFVYACLLGLLACQNKPTAAMQRQALEDQVMQVHDAAMADMDQLFVWQRQLKALRDTLQSRQPDTAAQRLLEQHLVLLQHADAAMMAWMHGYKSPNEAMTQEAARQYLEQQLQSMTGVKHKIDSSLAAAQRIYQKHEPNK